MSDTAATTRVLERPATRLLGVDALRFLGVFAVIVIHMLAGRATSFDITPEGVVEQSCRFAVPFFFIAGGFFLGRKNAAGTAATVWDIVKRTLPIFLFWTALYAALVPDVRVSALNLRSALILLGTGGSGYHLWFLPSYGLCMAVVAVSARHLRWGQMFALAFLLYAVGLAVGSYAGLFSHAGHATAAGLSIARGGPFFGTVFVLFGFWLARTSWRPSLFQCACATLLGLTLHLSEAFLLDIGGLTPFTANDFLLGTLLLGAGGFALALHLPSGNVLVGWAAKMGKYALGIYAVHLLLVLAFRALLAPASLGGMLATAAAVLVASTLVTLALARTRLMRPLVI